MKQKNINYHRGLILERNQGFSLLEVLVSLMVVSFGLLSLTALQSKVAKSSREALYVTAVSGAADSMLEMMYTNPTLTADASGIVTRNWSAYSTSTATISGAGSTTTGSTLVAKHKALFETIISQRLPSTGFNVLYRICDETYSTDTGGKPIMEGNAIKCSATTGKDTVIKVVWWTKADKDTQNTAANFLTGASGLSTGVQDRIMFGYQVKVGE